MAEGKSVVLRRGEREIDFARPPRVAEAALPYLSAFYALADQRHIDGMGAVGAIRYEAVTHWLDENSISDRVERDRYRFYLTEADREYLAVVNESRERDQRRREAEMKRASKVGGR